MKEDVKVKYEKEIRCIKYHIELNPGEPKFLVSAKTGVASEIIDKIIAKGIILEEGGILRLPVRQTIKGEARRKLLDELKQSVIEDKYKNKGRSRLLDDLEKRNHTNRHEEDER